MVVTQVWTIDSVLNNNTDYNPTPSVPTATAEWYGYPTSNPTVVSQNSAGESAGKFRAAKGTATGVTAISAYNCPDPSKVMVLLVMMPYGDPVNMTKVPLICINENLARI